MIFKKIRFYAMKVSKVTISKQTNILKAILIYKKKSILLELFKISNLNFRVELINKI